MNIKKIKAIRPMRDAVILTAFETKDYKNASGIIDITGRKYGSINLIQQVLAVGPQVTSRKVGEDKEGKPIYDQVIKVGDWVKIDPTRFGDTKYDKDSLQDKININYSVVYDFPRMEINGQQCLKLAERDIDYVITDWEEEAMEDSTAADDENLAKARQATANPDTKKKEIIIINKTK